MYTENDFMFLKSSRYDESIFSSAGNGVIFGFASAYSSAYFLEAFLNPEISPETDSFGSITTTELSESLRSSFSSSLTMSLITIPPRIETRLPEAISRSSRL